MDKTGYRSALSVNMGEQVLEGLRVSEVRMEYVLAWRSTHEHGLLAEVAQMPRQVGGDAGAVVRQNDDAAGKDGSDILEGRSIYRGDEHALNASPKRQR